MQPTPELPSTVSVRGGTIAAGEPFWAVVEGRLLRGAVERIVWTYSPLRSVAFLLDGFRLYDPDHVFLDRAQALVEAQRELEARTVYAQNALGEAEPLLDLVRKELRDLHTANSEGGRL